MLAWLTEGFTAPGVRDESGMKAPSAVRTIPTTGEIDVVVAVGVGSAAVEMGMVAAVVGAVITSVEAEGLGAGVGLEEGAGLDAGVGLEEGAGLGAGVGLEEGAGLDGVRLEDGVEIGVGVVV